METSILTGYFKSLAERTETPEKTIRDTFIDRLELCMTFYVDCKRGVLEKFGITEDNDYQALIEENLLIRGLCQNENYFGDNFILEEKLRVLIKQDRQLVLRLFTYITRTFEKKPLYYKEIMLFEDRRGSDEYTKKRETCIVNTKSYKILRKYDFDIATLIWNLEGELMLNVFSNQEEARDTYRFLFGNNLFIKNYLTDIFRDRNEKNADELFNHVLKSGTAFLYEETIDNNVKQSIVKEEKGIE